MDRCGGTVIFVNRNQNVVFIKNGKGVNMKNKCIMKITRIGKAKDTIINTNRITFEYLNISYSITPVHGGIRINKIDLTEQADHKITINPYSDNEIIIK